MSGLNYKTKTPNYMTNSIQMKETLEDIPDFPQLFWQQIHQNPYQYIHK